jgi:hypothetical protein
LVVEHIEVQEEGENDPTVEDEVHNDYFLKDYPPIPKPAPIPIRKNTIYNWLLYPDPTLKNLQKFIEEHPEYSAKEYTMEWNSLN